MTDIELVHQEAYDRGVDPVEHAVRTVMRLVEVRDAVRATRAYQPDACAYFVGGLDDESLARRIVAEMLNAGWSAPEVGA